MEYDPLKCENAELGFIGLYRVPICRMNGGICKLWIRRPEYITPDTCKDFIYNSKK